MSANEAAVETFQLLGQTRRLQLQNVLTDCVHAWRNDWAAAPGIVAVDVAERAQTMASPARAKRRLSMHVHGARSGHLMDLHAPLDSLNEMLGLEAGSTNAELTAAGSPIAYGVYVEALRALCTSVARRAGVDGVSVEHEVSGDARLGPRPARMHVATIKFAAGRCTLQLLLAPHFVDSLAPQARRERLGDAVSKRKAAIGEQTVRLDAWLGHAEVELRDLARLRCGDVIVLDLPLDGLGYLTVSNGQRIADVALGASNGARAVSVTGKSNGEARRRR